jgi:hypothetical protein
MPDDDRLVTHRFCPGCGAEAAAGSSFCATCGHSLSKASGGAGGSDLPPILKPDRPDPAKSVKRQPPGSVRPASPKSTQGTIPEEKSRGSYKVFWIVLIVVAVVGASGAGVVIAHHHSGPGASSNSSLSSGSVAICTNLLSSSDAARLSGASTMQVKVEPPQPFIRVASPTTSCYYNGNVVGADGFGVADLSKSFILWLWTNQADAAQMFADYATNVMNPRLVPGGPVAVQGIGRQADWAGGLLLVQASANDVFVLSSLPEATSIAEASKIVNRLGGSSSGISQSTTTLPPTTTTTTTTPLSSADQKFVDDVEKQFPSLPGAIAADEPYFTTKKLAGEGEAVCNAFSEAAQQGIANAYNAYIVGEFNNGNLPGSGGAIPSLTNSEVQVVLGIAIEDICPTYLGDIPPGDPGAP